MGGAPTGLSARFSKQSESALPPGSTAKSAHGVRNRGARSISLSLRTEHSEPRCAYCHSPERLLGLPLEVDHIVPTTAGGRTLLDNLCLCCRSCNGHKWQQTHAQDPKPGDVCASTILGANNGRDISPGIEAARVFSEQRQRAVQQ